jgi:hypothetical protein
MRYCSFLQSRLLKVYSTDECFECSFVEKYGEDVPCPIHLSVHLVVFEIICKKWKPHYCVTLCVHFSTCTGYLSYHQRFFEHKLRFHLIVDNH